MDRLKKENIKECVSLLREFIDNAQTANEKKGIAGLALDQLQRITAGQDRPAYATCVNRPMMEARGACTLL